MAYSMISCFYSVYLNAVVFFPLQSVVASFDFVAACLLRLVLFIYFAVVIIIIIIIISFRVNIHRVLC